MLYSLLPKFLQIELTYACNSACIFCYNPNHNRNFDARRTLSVVKEINKFRIKHVQLIGGEVTIIPELCVFLDNLDQCEWRSVVTNGRIFVPELDGRVNEVYLSLHGEKNVHEKITNATGSFEIIEDTIKRYVDLGIAVHSDTVLTSANYDQIYAVGRRAHELGMRTLFVNIFQPEGIGANFKTRLSPSIEQIRKAITQMISVRHDFDLEVQFGTSTPFCLDERLIPEKLAFTCGAGTWFASIDPDGNLRICNQSTRSYGNILEKPLNEIWHSREISSDYRSKAWIDGPCSDCIFRDDCLGGCRIDGSGTPRIDPLMQGRTTPLIAREKLVEIAKKHKPDIFVG